MSNNMRPETMQRITTPELAEAFIAEQVAEVRAQVGDKKVLLALSGGVDSSVVAALLIKAIGKQLVCVHVNHGLMRKDESENVIKVFKDELDANLIYVDATDRFLDLLAGVADPEKKSKQMSFSLEENLQSAFSISAKLIKGNKGDTELEAKTLTGLRVFPFIKYQKFLKIPSSSGVNIKKSNKIKITV